MKNLFKTNKQGHNQAMWNYFVKGTPRRREWYARRLASSMGETLSRRERLAAELQSGPGAFDVERDKGFRVFAPGMFEEVDQIVPAANALVAEQADKKNAGSKDFLQQGFLNTDALTLESPFLKWAMREDVIAGISSYLGVVPVLQKMDVWRSDNTPSQHHASQLYHCDWDDTAQLKVFVYCGEVDTASGPLSLIDSHASDALKKKVGYTYDRKGYRVDDAQADEIVGTDVQHTITGPKGTVVFADTSRCFHYGSRVLEGGKPRIVAHYQFVTPNSFLYPPSGYPDVAPYRHLAGAEFSQLQRLVLGAD